MLDRGWQLAAVRVPREARSSTARSGGCARARRARRPTRSTSSTTSQDHVLRTAQAHIDRVVLEAFVAGIERTTDPAAKALLDRVCDLYALSTIEADKGWFLEHGRLTPTRAKALTGAVNDLLKELRPHMRTLVDAFAIPDAWLNCAHPGRGAGPPGGDGRARRRAAGRRRRAAGGRHRHRPGDGPRQ